VISRCKHCGTGLDTSGKTINFWHPFCGQKCFWSYLVKMEKRVRKGGEGNFKRIHGGSP